MSEVLMMIATMVLFIVFLFAIYLMAVLSMCDSCPYKSLCNGKHSDDFIPPCQRPRNIAWPQSSFCDRFLA